jgi:hypothetical protein
MPSLTSKQKEKILLEKFHSKLSLTRSKTPSPVFTKRKPLEEIPF